MWIDPAAASLKLELSRRGFPVRNAKNDVVNGIRLTGSLLENKILKVSPVCFNLLKEAKGYVWDAKKQEYGEDAPIKKNDHAMDAMRYYVYSRHQIHATRLVEKPVGM